VLDSNAHNVLIFPNLFYAQNMTFFISNYCKQIGGVERKALSRSAPGDT